MHGSMRDTRVVVVGVCMEQDSFRPLTGIGKINIQFVLGYTQHEFADTLRGISEGELVVDQLITGRVGLDGVAQAFDDLNDPEVREKLSLNLGNSCSRFYRSNTHAEVGKLRGSKSWTISCSS